MRNSVKLPSRGRGFRDRIPAPNVSYDFRRMAELPSNFTFTRTGTTGTAFDAEGVLQTLAENEPAFPHKFNGSIWEPLGFQSLLAVTNLFLHSNDFSQTAWTKTNGGVTSGYATGPDGTSSMWRLLDDSGGGLTFVDVREDVVLTNAEYCMSVFAKADQLSGVYFRTLAFTNNANSRFNLSDGTVTGTTHTSAGVIDCGNGLYRVYAVFTPGADAAGQISIGPCTPGAGLMVDRDGTSSVLLFGAMVHPGSYPAPYVATGAATATRAADVLTLPAPDGLCAGVFKGRTPPTLVGNQYLGAISLSGAASERVYFYLNSSGILRMRTVTGNVLTNDLTAATLGVNEDFAFAWRFHPDGSGVSVNGASPVTGANAVPASFNQVNLGADRTGANQWGNTIKSADLFTFPPSDYQLKVLST